MATINPLRNQYSATETPNNETLTETKMMATINPPRYQSSATETPKNETLTGKTERLYNNYITLNKKVLAENISTSELNTLQEQSTKALRIFLNLGIELETNKQFYKNTSDETILPLLFAGFIYVIYITETVGQAALISTIVPEILIATAIFGSMVGFFVYTNNKYHQYKTAEEHHSHLSTVHRANKQNPVQAFPSEIN